MLIYQPLTSEPLVYDGDSGGGYAYVGAEDMENSLFYPLYCDSKTALKKLSLFKKNEKIRLSINSNIYSTKCHQEFCTIRSAVEVLRRKENNTDWNLDTQKQRTPQIVNNFQDDN